MATIAFTGLIRAFDPDATRALGLAFDDAWRSIEDTGSVLAQPFRASDTRLALARHIVDLAQHGERDPVRLRNAALSRMRLAAGEVLIAECTDPLSAIDIPNLLRETGDMLEESRQDAGLLVFRIRKAGPVA